jgi:hypothetical protein
MAEAGGAGNYKIGRTSKDLDDRLRRVQTGNPHRLFYTIIGYGLGWIEGTLHAAFEDDRLHGEWFRKGGVTEAFIDHLWATCEGNPRQAADIFEAASLALRSRSLMQDRALWKREAYDEVTNHYRRLGERLLDYVHELDRECALRFEPVAALAAAEPAPAGATP